MTLFEQAMKLYYTPVFRKHIDGKLSDDSLPTNYDSWQKEIERLGEPDNNFLTNSFSQLGYLPR